MKNATVKTAKTRATKTAKTKTRKAKKPSTRRHTAKTNDIFSFVSPKLTPEERDAVARDMAKGLGKYLQKLGVRFK